MNQSSFPCFTCLSCHKGIPNTLDRFCQNCGVALPSIRQPSRSDQSASDQSEYVRSPQVAGITNRGFWHSKNEDAIAIECLGNGRTLMVVCDGVSSSAKPEAASEVAAQATAQALHQTGGQSPCQAIVQAIGQAQIAVSSLAPVSPENPPSTTIVAALVDPNAPCPTATIGWIGDSRAYWLSPTEAKLLTEDDSWINWVRTHGQLPDHPAFDYPARSHACSQAFSQGFSDDESSATVAGVDLETVIQHFATSPYAHAITRWLGARKSSLENDLVPDTTPSIVQVPLQDEGFLILCSDGLWNYVSQPDRLLQVLDGQPQENALTIAQNLVNHALRCGGHDNVSVAVFHQSSR